MKPAFYFAAFILLITISTSAYAQYMPVVYDKNFNSSSEILCIENEFLNGDVVISTHRGEQQLVAWLDRDGNPLSVKEFESHELSTINKLIALSDDQLLIVGDFDSAKDSKKSSVVQKRGVVMIISKYGIILRRAEIGSVGTSLYNAELLDNGSFIVSGSGINSSGENKGFIGKISSQDVVSYEYFAPYGSLCSEFTVQQGVGQNVFAVFSGNGSDGTSVSRLDENGKPYYSTHFSDKSFVAEKMILTKDQEVLVVGQGTVSGGAIIKLRREGDIVFQKQIIPSTPLTTMKYMAISEEGYILVGGKDTDNAFYTLLRNDGTVLSSNVDRGFITDLTIDKVNGESAVGIYDNATKTGSIVKLSSQGDKLFQKKVSAIYNDLSFNYFGDIIMVSAKSGRISQLSSFGDLLFDRYVKEYTPEIFKQAHISTNGNVIFVGNSGRLAKLAHGIFVSDVKVIKPINGKTNAIFTVNLSGFSYMSDGSPIPVSVNYNTIEGSAKQGRNFNPVNGTISFIPSSDGTERYLHKFVVEVPIMSNDMLEGDRVFSLDLLDVKNSYLIRAKSNATIIDQPAIVKLNSTTPGYEGGGNINYELGIYKTNGVTLTNDTGADIVVDGTYSRSSADQFDFQKGRIPRVVISANNHNGNFEVIPIEDTRYESTKNVVIEFDRIYSMSDTKISFIDDELIAIGELHDQPAMVSIESLGNSGKTSNVVSALFKVSLLRAKDGVLLTNNSGGDLIINLSANTSNTANNAVMGKDYIFTNLHNARIWGDGTSSAVNIEGVIMQNETNNGNSKNVSLDIEGVKVTTAAIPVSVDPKSSSATFKIKKSNK